jgi:small basic protein
VHIPDLYTWWYFIIPTILIPLVLVCAIIIAIDALIGIIRNPNKYDFKDKIFSIVIIIGIILVIVGMIWKNQLYLDFNEKGIYLEQMDDYFKQALQPMLIYTIGEIFIGISAFLKTSTNLILKIKALIFIINAVTFNFQCFLEGSHML